MSCPMNCRMNRQMNCGFQLIYVIVWINFKRINWPAKLRIPRTLHLITDNQTAQNHLPRLKVLNASRLYLEYVEWKAESWNSVFQTSCDSLIRMLNLWKFGWSIGDRPEIGKQFADTGRTNKSSFTLKWLDRWKGNKMISKTNESLFMTQSY